MSTRSRIAMETQNGSVHSIYCHYDGYPEYNGAILQTHYQDEDKIRALIELGDLSSLDASIEAPEGHSTGKRIKGYTFAYGRDGGQTDTGPDIDDTREAFFARCTEGWEEFAYLRVAGEWWVSSVGGGCGPFLGRDVMPANWKLLRDVLAGDTDLYGEDAA